MLLIRSLLCETVLDCLAGICSKLSKMLEAILPTNATISSLNNSRPVLLCSDIFFKTFAAHATLSSVNCVNKKMKFVIVSVGDFNCCYCWC